MIVYLAGENGKTQILNTLRGGGKNMIIYLAGEHPVKNGRVMAANLIGGGR